MSLQPQTQDQDNAQHCCSHNTQLTDVGKSLSENTTVLSAMLTDFGKSVSENVEFLSTLKDLVPTLQRMISAQKSQVLLHQQLDHFKSIGDKVQDTLIEIRQSLPMQIDRPSFYFLDACGFSYTFDLAFFDNWEILESTIGAKFRERGLQVVEKKQYVLEDALRKQALDRTRSFKAFFLPGRQINMDACFDDKGNLGASCCPVCQHVEDSLPDAGIDW
jgi:hypothetical protein